MKIGIFDPYLDTLGGGEKYMLSIAECLSREHDVSIFWDNKAIGGEAEKRFSLDLSRIAFTRDIFSKKSGIVRRFGETRKYDLLIYLSDGSIPMVFSRHLFLHFQFPTEWVGTLSPQAKIKLHRVDKLICNSQYTKQFIDKEFGKESEVIYPPVDIEHSYVKGEKENIILTVGRHTRPKGVDFKKHGLLVEAFKKICPSFPNWKLVILTNSLPDDVRYIDELEQAARGQKVVVERNATRSTVLSYYSRAKIYWHAAGYGEDIATHPELAEHFGIVTVEAMNRGAVPVVFGAGGQKEIVKNGRSGYLWNSLDDLVDKTSFLITHENDRKKLAKNAYEDSLQYDKKTFCNKIHSLVNEI